LIAEEKCEDVQLEQQTYCGKYSETCEKEKAKQEEKDRKTREEREAKEAEEKDEL